MKRAEAQTFIKEMNILVCHPVWNLPLQQAKLQLSFTRARHKKRLYKYFKTMMRWYEAFAQKFQD